MKSERGLVERVATMIGKQRGWAEPGVGIAEQVDARAIIEEVAEALEGHMEDTAWKQEGCACEREAMSAVEAFDWLRNQAQESPDE